MGNIRVTVDHELCSGTAHCRATYPDLFAVRRRKAWVREDVDWDAVDLDRLRQAEAGCPWFAIAVAVDA